MELLLEICASLKSLSTAADSSPKVRDLLASPRASSALRAAARFRVLSRPSS